MENWFCVLPVLPPFLLMVPGPLCFWGISTASTRLCQDGREKRGKFIILGFHFPLQAMALGIAVLFKASQLPLLGSAVMEKGLPLLYSRPQCEGYSPKFFAAASLTGARVGTEHHRQPPPLLVPICTILDVLTHGSFWCLRGKQRTFC